MAEDPTVSQYRAGYARGIEVERARIREELLATDLGAIAARVALKHGVLDVPLHEIVGNTDEAVRAQTAVRLDEELRALVDRICPEE